VRAHVQAEYQYKKAGIMLSEISPVSHHQGDLLEEPAPAQGTLMQTLDALNKRFGRGAVKVSTQGAYSGWQMRQERRSPNYTTDYGGAGGLSGHKKRVHSHKVRNC
jgi:DNA polymerase V